MTLLSLAWFVAWAITASETGAFSAPSAPSKINPGNNRRNERRSNRNGHVDVNIEAHAPPVGPMVGVGNYSVVWSTSLYDQWYAGVSLLSASEGSSSVPFMMSGGNWCVHRAHNNDGSVLSFLSSNLQQMSVVKTTQV